MAATIDYKPRSIFTNPFLDDHEVIIEQSKTLDIPTEIVVPIINSIHSSPGSSAATISTTSSRSTEASDAPSPGEVEIQWTNTDINYLLSILYPSLVMTHSLILSPPLEDLDGHRNPFTLSLYVKQHGHTVPKEAYNKYLPIGTGRPTSAHRLLASTPLCASPQLAREYLATLLLNDCDRINCIYADFKFLSSVFSLCDGELVSLYRGLKVMMRTDDTELLCRYYQLKGEGIGEGDELGCRVEMFMLQADEEERERWLKAVKVGVKMGEKRRGEWARTYEFAARFLRQAVLG